MNDVVNWKNRKIFDGKKKKTKIIKGTGTFTSLTPLTMQDMKLNTTATLIDQSMSPYHAGEPFSNGSYEITALDSIFTGLIN